MPCGCFAHARRDVHFLTPLRPRPLARFDLHAATAEGVAGKLTRVNDASDRRKMREALGAAYPAFDNPNQPGGSIWKRKEGVPSDVEL